MNQIQLVLRKGYSRLTENQRQNLRGLGLKKREQLVILEDTRAIRGMINKVIHLVDVSRPVERAEKERRTVVGDDIEVSAVKQAKTSDVSLEKSTKKKVAGKKK
ncbi:MAG: 50S ribosomal protein L30, partial [Bdellovibrionales bacterium]|nr:50S ribosomal protein L30 [Bdellovibrionales bacterium]